MHECIEVERGLFERKLSELSWGIAAYIELAIRSGKVERLEVCQHESFRPFEDLDNLVSVILQKSYSNELEALSSLWNLLTEVFPDWRRDFEIIIKPSSISITIYM